MKKENPMEAFAIRHSVAEYKTYQKINKSDDPQQPVTVENQEIDDLTEKGKELARVEAEKFFAQLDPQRDTLFFASSNEARAIETANIYLEIARARGFEVLHPEHSRNNYSDKISGGDIRILDSLSLKTKNTLLHMLFNPFRPSINWEAVPKDVEKKWDEAKAIIETDNQKSWGANFLRHSEEIQKIFPELASARDLYEKQFKDALRLVQFANRKAQESGLGKDIKVLGFGHENYLAFALDKYFGEHETKNCEAIRISVLDSGVELERRGEKMEIK